MLERIEIGDSEKMIVLGLESRPIYNSKEVSMIHLPALAW